MEKVYKENRIGELNVKYEARCEGFKIIDIDANINGGGISITRTYWSDGSFKPTASKSRLTNEENEAILADVMGLYDKYGVYVQPEI